MTLRILKLLFCLLALLVADGCAKRQTKQIGTGGKTPNKSGDAETGQGPDEGKSSEGESESEDDDGPSNNKEEEETYPEGLSKSEYEEGQKYVGGWTGLEDEPDPRGKWTLKAMPNPEALEGSLSSEGASGAGGVTLAEVRPIIQGACASCHNPNGSQPTSPMVTDEQLLRQMSSIKSRVRNGSMPPNGGLPPDQKDLIARWTEDAGPSTEANPYPQQGPQQQQRPQQQGPSGYGGGSPAGGGNFGGSGTGAL